MPKVKNAYLAERIRKRIAELEAGDEVPAKDIRAVLTNEQQAAIDTAWAEQQQLRKGKRARTEQEQQALGWRNKRDIRLLVLRQALKEADAEVLSALQEELKQSEIRQSKIYLRSFFKAIREGKPRNQAENWANNELTRAGLNRLDGQRVNSFSQGDKKLRELEDKLDAVCKKNMSATKTEQQEILKAHEASVKRQKKK